MSLSKYFLKECVFATVFSLLLTLYMAGQPNLSLPPDLRLLESSKADLKKQFPVVIDRETYIRASYGDFFMDAEIAEEPCTWHGWNVATGTILSIKLIPKHQSSVVISQQADYEVVTDDTLGEYLTDRKKGVQYYVNADRLVQSTRFFPIGSPRNRCPGFPDFDPSHYTLSPYIAFSIRNFSEWDMGLLGDVGMRLSNSKETKAVLTVYFEKGDFLGGKAFQINLAKYLNKILRVPSDQVEVRLGGLRDANELEVFLLPADVPIPKPRPKYASSMLFREGNN